MENITESCYFVIQWSLQTRKDYKTIHIKSSTHYQIHFKFSTTESIVFVFKISYPFWISDSSTKVVISRSSTITFTNSNNLYRDAFSSVLDKNSAKMTSNESKMWISKFRHHFAQIAFTEFGQTGLSGHWCLIVLVSSFAFFVCGYMD